MNTAGSPIAALSLAANSAITINGPGGDYVSIGGTDRNSGVNGAVNIAGGAGGSISLAGTGNLEFTTSGGIISSVTVADVGGITETNNGSLIFDTGTGTTGTAPVTAPAPSSAP